MDRDFKGVWIPKDIWLNKNLSPLDKCLLAEIDSLDRENECFASNDYLAEFCQVGKATITRSIQKLCELGFITTETRKSTTGSYRVIKMSRGGSNQFDDGGLINLSTNYNSNNNINVLSKDNTTNGNSEFQFGKVETKPKKPKISPNTAEYNDAMFMVTAYTTNKELRKELTRLVNMKKDMASKEHYKFYASTIKNYLDELDETFADDENQKIEAVKLSIRYNGTTKVMIPNSTPKNKCVDNVQSEHKTDYKPALDENGNPIVF